MCGFLGEYNTTTERSKFTSILHLSKHRGPDSSAVWSGQGIRLGFNRLAIQDISPAGAQPMKSPNGHFVIVFNGEIYNHLELRKQLPRITYQGHSDTETIAHALDVWGVKKTIESLDGMFALGIYDVRTEQLWLARDFAGIKPLFFGKHNHSIVFASQYDQIIAHPLFQSASVNPEVLKLYLQQHFVPAPFGLYKGTGQLLPGEIIRFSKDGHQEHFRYWELPSTVDADIYRAKEAAEIIEEALFKSVEMQLLSDVPLGAFLSGGVDSPLICALASRVTNDLSVYSIGSDSPTHDESKRSKAFADAINLQQHLWKLDSDEVVMYWEEAMDALHEPMADFSLLPTFLVSKLARREVTVALSGDGGDELFYGYERFWSIGKNIRYQHFPKLTRMGIYGMDKYYSGNRNVNSVLLSSSQGSAHESLHSRFPSKWIDEIFPDLQSVSLPEEWMVYNYPNTKDEKTLIGYMRYSEFYGMMQKTLRKVDLASMQNSLEVRVPFLQKSFIHAALRIDPMLSYGQGRKKQVLKEILANLIPSVPDDNVKRGFSIPLSDWIRGSLRDVFRDRMNTSSLQDFGIDTNAVNKMLDNHMNGQSLKWPLFTIYALPK